MDIESRLKEKVDQRIKNSSNRCLDLPIQNTNTSSITTATTAAAAGPLDFSSNDYLGLAHSRKQHDLVEQKYKAYTKKYPPGPGCQDTHLGSTGSRLLSGNSNLAIGLERFIARVHNRPAALLCNSGYDANLSLLSSLPQDDDVIVMDELVHNSLIMGVRMSRVPFPNTKHLGINTNSTTTSSNNKTDQVQFFRHNNMNDLERVLSTLSCAENSSCEKKRCVFVVVESVYSMDGDISPLREILDLSERYNASAIVDEAHGLGIYGYTNHQDMNIATDNIDTHKHQSKEVDQNKNEDNPNLRGCRGGGTGVLAALNLENHPALLAGVFTFGKAAGCHGAAITGSQILIDYLVNYARPFIYSTSLPSHSLWAVKCAYDTIIGEEGDYLRRKVFYLVKLFRSLLLNGGNHDRSHDGDDDGSQGFLLSSPSPIQAVVCRGNDNCIKMANALRNGMVDSEGNTLKPTIMVYPIRSPTVAKGEERIRIILHAHNTEMEVRHLVDSILKFRKHELLIGRKEITVPMTSKL